MKALVENYAPRNGDAPKILFGQRLSVCGRCAKCRVNYCEVSDQLVSVLARRKAEVCPDGKWPGDQKIVPQPGVLTITVAIICHNYGRFLAECVRSVVGQTMRANQILIVDDASDDETAEVARGFSGSCEYVHVEHRNVHQSRRAAYERATGDLLVFLDADDILPEDYLATGRKEFDDHQVAVVYSDVLCFGDSVADFETLRYIDYDPAAHRRGTFIHAGSIVRRTAIDQSGAFGIEIDPAKTQDDWFLWRRVLQRGWIAKKQGAVYLARRHNANSKVTYRRVMLLERNYYDYAGLRHENVSIFVPLAGRWFSWGRLRNWLGNQTWPADQVELILLDTSRDNTFQKTIRRWLLNSRYQNFRLITNSVGVKGLADRIRKDDYQVQMDAARAMPIVYSHIQSALHPFTFVVEDDVIPPVDAIESLMRCMDGSMDSVTGAYKTRHGADNYSAAYRYNQHAITKAGTGVEAINRSGFGCLLLRSDVVTTFTADTRQRWYDCAFFERLTGKHKINWDVQCDHLSPDNGRTSLLRRSLSFISNAIAVAR